MKERAGFMRQEPFQYFSISTSIRQVPYSNRYLQKTYISSDRRLMQFRSSIQSISQDYLTSFQHFVLGETREQTTVILLSTLLLRKSSTALSMSISLHKTRRRALSVCRDCVEMFCRLVSRYLWKICRTLMMSLGSSFMKKWMEYLFCAAAYSTLRQYSTTFSYSSTLLKLRWLSTNVTILRASMILLICMQFVPRQTSIQPTLCRKCLVFSSTKLQLKVQKRILITVNKSPKNLTILSLITKKSFSYGLFQIFQGLGENSLFELRAGYKVFITPSQFYSTQARSFSRMLRQYWKILIFVSLGTLLMRKRLQNSPSLQKEQPFTSRKLLMKGPSNQSFPESTLCSRDRVVSISYLKSTSVPTKVICYNPHPNISAIRLKMSMTDRTTLRNEMKSSRIIISTASTRFISARIPMYSFPISLQSSSILTHTFYSLPLSSRVNSISRQNSMSICGWHSSPNVSLMMRVKQAGGDTGSNLVRQQKVEREGSIAIMEEMMPCRSPMGNRLILLLMTLHCSSSVVSSEEARCSCRRSWKRLFSKYPYNCFFLIQMRYSCLFRSSRLSWRILQIYNGGKQSQWGMGMCVVGDLLERYQVSSLPLVDPGLGLFFLLLEGLQTDIGIQGDLHFILALFLLWWRVVAQKLVGEGAICLRHLLLLDLGLWQDVGVGLGIHVDVHDFGVHVHVDIHGHILSPVVLLLPLALVVVLVWVITVMSRRVMACIGMEM